MRSHPDSQWLPLRARPSPERPSASRVPSGVKKSDVKFILLTSSSQTECGHSRRDLFCTVPKAVCCSWVFFAFGSTTGSWYIVFDVGVSQTMMNQIPFSFDPDLADPGYEITLPFRTPPGSCGRAPAAPRKSVLPWSISSRTTSALLSSVTTSSVPSTTSHSFAPFSSCCRMQASSCCNRVLFYQLF